MLKPASADTASRNFLPGIQCSPRFFFHGYPVPATSFNASCSSLQFYYSRSRHVRIKFYCRPRSRKYTTNLPPYFDPCRFNTSKSVRYRCLRISAIFLRANASLYDDPHFICTPSRIIITIIVYTIIHAYNCFCISMNIIDI